MTEGQIINGFRTTAVYLNDSDAPIGARLVHEKSGFLLDLLEIQSVPQAFVWVTTYPTSDMGEPHTQEHLLLGKGNKGRAVASHEPMSLAVSTAFTMQYKTCYSFYTSAGPNVFYEEFERRMDALLHPDYTDEEVNREVRNFGISDNPRDKTLGLEEKGSVYNEMVTSTDQPGRRIYSAALNMIYGAGHPLQFNSGGSPEALRVIQPSDIRKFHAANYHLANMGAVISVPKDMTVESVLRRMDSSLSRVQPQRSTQPVVAEKNLPLPKAAPAGEIRFVEYPHRSDQQPGSVWLTWPADRSLDVTEQTLLSLFLETLAGDPTTNLYKRFIDSKTKEWDLGAQSVFGSLQEDQGFPVLIGFGDVPVSKMNERDLSSLRSRVLDELNRIVSWRDGSAELDEFNQRLRSRVIEMRRSLAKFVNSPPGFGFRGTGAEWMLHLNNLNKEGGFRKSVTMKSVLEAVEKSVGSRSNIWARYLSKWKLTEVQPWVLATKPNPSMTQEQQKEREVRVAAELRKLRSRYGVSDDQESIRRYRADYDKASAVIEEAAGRVTPPKFVDNPPMTLDDQLDFKVQQLDRGVRFVVSTFESMTSATTGIALRLDGVVQDRLLYLSMLPQLLTRVGVIENGKPVSYETMSERLRKEILSLNADFSTNSKTGRVELLVRGSGNNIDESQKALEWMQLVMFSPDWRPENLARIRDVVDQTLSGMRRTMQSAEENWVRPVATAYWRQDNPLLLTTTSFMTQIHNVHRLRWMLKDAALDQRSVAARFLNELAGLKGARADLKKRLTELQAGSDKLIADAAKDLDLTLADIPDSSLELDWEHLCREMAADLSVGAENTLAVLNSIRQQVLKTGNARMFQIASTASQRALTANVARLVGRLEAGTTVKAGYDGVRIVESRLRQRDPNVGNPLFVGLLNPNSQGGVFLNSAPLAGFEDTDREKILNYLSTNLYGGGGGHSIFMKTWGAGLAYSNGIATNLTTGRLSYYAERTPELPQTLRFVIGELQNAKADPALVEYAIAQAFTGTRSANSYESRGEQMAQNLADGLTPEIVTRFHKLVLDLRKTGDLAGDLYRRMPNMSARVLPGMGTKAADVNDGVFFVIGPEKQFTAWEEYLKSVEGTEARVYRLYPRDFWM